MERRRFALALLAALALGACGGSADPGTGPDDPKGRPPGLETPDAASVTKGENAASRLGAPYVVLVSLDGFASRYVAQYRPPALQAMAAQGVWARDGMIPVFPTLTFPNHWALATGLYPEHSGLVSNTFLDPARGAWYSLGDQATVTDGTWYGGEPLWVTAERQGMVAASYFWVGSEAAVGGVRPSYWRTYDAGVPNDQRVDQVLEWLRYPQAYRPHMITLYMSTTDAVGHAYGPDSPQMASAVASVDASIARLVAGVDALEHGSQVTLIVLADHGMDGYGVAGRRYMADAATLEGVTVAASGPAANLHLAAGVEAAAVRDALGGLDGVAAYLRGEVPERLHYRADPRIGDVVLVADSGVVVYPENDREETPGWTHGWDNGLLSMRALFVARGPLLPRGRVLEPFELVHVYPLVTRLLGLAPAAGIDGSTAFWDRVLQGS
ncbi:MAG: alkaline phosphatase family protein [Gemmatimonadota bacterium]